MSTYNMILSSNESTVVAEYEPQVKRSDSYQSGSFAGRSDYRSRNRRMSPYGGPGRYFHESGRD